SGLNATEVEIGVCSVTCGIGIREVLLTSGCPGTEEKCIVRVEECRGPVDCGWGIPIPEGPACVKMPCISISPENQFTYVWKMLIANKTSHLLLNDSAVLKVCRDTHSLIFQCETWKNGNTIASVKYRVYAATGMQTMKPRTIETNPLRKKMLDTILVFCLITGVIVIALEIFAMIFIVVFW
ncbi:SACA1 protein, partial [Caloenas nicobarica]|nr:SACA1 protein [Caloenas nicobarica]